MGIYINPKDMSKEKWLETNATQITEEAFKAFAFTDNSEDMLVAWVQNPGFSAAAVAFDDREREAFTQPWEARPIRYYLTKRVKLHEFMPASLHFKG